MHQVVFSLILFVSLLSADQAVAANIEQVADLHVHDVFGTGNGLVVKTGLADGGEYVALFKWDDTDSGFSSSNAATLRLRNVLPTGVGSDGSFSIHQMITDWNESTSFGTTLPVAGIDYVAHPVAAGGMNNAEPSIDTVALTILVDAWLRNSGLNKGIILVPRPQFNANYPLIYSPEIQFGAHDRNPALSLAEDCYITTSTQPAASWSIDGQIWNPSGRIWMEFNI